MLSPLNPLSVRFREDPSPNDVLHGWTWQDRNSAERNDMADSREVMNIRQASQYLGVSPDTLYKYVNEQKIPAFKLGNRWRFKKSRLDQWMEVKTKKAKAASQAAT